MSSMAGKMRLSHKKKIAAKYKTDPRKANLAVLARNEKKLAEFKKQADVVRLVKRGNTFEQVSEKLGISPKEALTLTKQAIDKWAGELSLDAKENATLDLQRIDAMLLLVWDAAQPKPLYRKDGAPLLDRETGDPIMGAPDLESIKVWNSLMDRRARMLGLMPETSAIVVNNQVNIVERRYSGVSPEDL